MRECQSAEGFELKIVAFLCTWCSYAGADLAGTGRNQYPPNIRVIRIPCSGRINPLYIIKALLEGADGVMVSGCHPGDCHYLVGNYHARRRFTVLKKLLTTAGFDPDRVHFTWVSASEGVRFSQVVKDVTKRVRATGDGRPYEGEGNINSSQQLNAQSCITHVRATGDSRPYEGEGNINSSQQLNAQSCITHVRATGDGRPYEGEGNSTNNRQSNVLSYTNTVGATVPGRPSPTYIQNHKEQKDELITLCAKLLKEGMVDAIVGFQDGGELGMSLPCFIDTPNDADKLVWNNRCVPNLSGYLLEKPVKTAIVAKPCDARAVVSLIKENQLKRDDVYIIGMVCDGMVDDEGRLLHGCADCIVKIPPVCDVLIGDVKDVAAAPMQLESAGSLIYKIGSPDNSGEPVADSNKLLKNEQHAPDENQCTSDEKWHISSKKQTTHDENKRIFNERFKRFVSEISKCILCFSCRQACYGCYCPTCFMDRGEPNWQPTSPDMGSKMLYHLVRTMHLAGRCVECGACENACASGVDIRYLIREVSCFIEETYGYQAGMDLETEPAMLTFKPDDPEIGFLE